VHENNLPSNYLALMHSLTNLGLLFLLYALDSHRTEAAT